MALEVFLILLTWLPSAICKMHLASPKCFDLHRHVIFCKAVYTAPERRAKILTAAVCRVEGMPACILRCLCFFRTKTQLFRDVKIEQPADGPARIPDLVLRMLLPLCCGPGLHESGMGRFENQDLRSASVRAGAEQLNLQRLHRTWSGSGSWKRCKECWGRSTCTSFLGRPEDAGRLQSIRAFPAESVICLRQVEIVRGSRLQRVYFLVPKVVMTKRKKRHSLL